MAHTEHPGLPPVATHPVDAADPDDAASSRSLGDAPFGLPVLAEVPELAGLLEDLRCVDRLIARAVTTIQLLIDTALTEHATGLGLDHWIRVIARRTNTDTRMLIGAADVLPRIPSLEAAFNAGEVSWAQVRSVVLTVRPLPRHLDDGIDAAIADALHHGAATGDADPDALVRMLDWEIAALDDTSVARTEVDAHRHEYLAMQPRLDGTGGRLHGELGPVSWAIIDTALNPTGPAAADPAPAIERPDHTPTTPGKRRLDRLVHLLDDVLEQHQTATRSPTDGIRARPQLLLRADLATLLDQSRAPAELLTTLTGGHVRITATRPGS